MKVNFRKLRHAVNLLRRWAGISLLVFRRLWLLRKRGRLLSSLKFLGLIMVRGFGRTATEFLDLTEDFGTDLNSVRLQKLRGRVSGLHQLLPSDRRFSYSILIPVYRPNPKFFFHALRSAIHQSAPDMEILIGFDGPQSEEVLAVVDELKSKYPDSAHQLKIFQLERASQGGGISQTTNFLAEKATKNFLVLMDHDDWIRPDLLFRYEQTLRSLPAAQVEQTVLYCDEFKIDEKDVPVVDSWLRKPLRPEFPFLFINWICHCLLVPRAAWVSVNGLRSECNGAQDFDLCLRLHASGLDFQNVPFFMYAWRAHGGSTAGSVSQKDYATPAGVKALEDFCQSQNLRWKIGPGDRPTTYRAIPPAGSVDARVLVVVPFKNEREITLKCAEAIRRQTHGSLDVVFADNCSTDAGIAEDLRLKGHRVIRVEEAFNFSRINNLAVAAGLMEKHKAILFLNNDVILDPDCVEEMLRWCLVDKVGAVGAQLRYPNGRLQHGGISIDSNAPADKIAWSHVDHQQPLGELGFAGVLGVQLAVTGACLMTRPDVFKRIGGFDEIWYPIAFSDTDLCRRIRKEGYSVMYSPWARGVHFESLSRGYGAIEDFEASRWAQELADVRAARQTIG